MGLSSKLFFDTAESETLFTRISLSKEQIKDAKDKKDKLLELLKPELSTSLETSVKHWLQGSYKNHTLIRPVRKGEEFDIDIGIYLLCNAESEGFGALDVKTLNKDVLKWYVSNRPEARLEDSKTCCERLSYPSSFHIDIPIYFYDDETGVCKLATQKDEWVDSDPKAFQDWFDGRVSSLTVSSIAQLRRIIKYLKTWTLLKAKDDGITIPSIALTVLTVNYYIESECDDEAFMQTTIGAMNYILENRVLENPAQGGDLFGFSDGDYFKIKSKALALKNSCEFIDASADSFEQYVLWSATFEHMFPPFVVRKEEVTRTTNLPAKTIPPSIRVCHKDKSGATRFNDITDAVNVFRDEELYFSISNTADYNEISEVHWIVRNQDSEAKRVNDLGHTSVMSIREERYEGCSYSGTHYMECLILENNNIMGIGAVKVKICGFSRPLRNPPRKRHFKRK
jgi:hypothetical protein